MTKKMTLASVGTFILACAAIIAAKPIKKARTISTCYGGLATGHIVTAHLLNGFTTVIRVNHTAFFASNFSAPNLVTLYTSPSASGKVCYMKPGF